MARASSVWRSDAGSTSHAELFAIWHGTSASDTNILDAGILDCDRLVLK